MDDAIFETAFHGLRVAQPTPPRSWYLDPEQYQREISRIWTRTWIYVCRSAELADPGSFRAVTLVGHPILLVRSPEGDLRGFHNACRHRGAALCLTETGRLSKAGIVCPYHAWTYGFDGALLKAGVARPFAGFDPVEHGLRPIAVAEHRGFIFINLDAETRGFDEEWLSTWAEGEKWPLEDLVLAHRWTKSIASNWKIYYENYSECLHCPGVHPELCAMVPMYGQGWNHPKDNPEWSAVSDTGDPALVGGLKTGAQTWSLDGALTADPLPGIVPEDVPMGYRFVTLMPTTYLNFHLDFVRIVRILPLAVDRTELQVDWLYHRDAVARPGFDPTRAVEFAKLVLTQDAEMCELNQRGLQSPAHDRGMLMSEEFDLHAFHRWVQARAG